MGTHRFSAYLNKNIIKNTPSNADIDTYMQIHVVISLMWEIESVFDLMII